MINEIRIILNSTPNILIMNKSL